MDKVNEHDYAASKAAVNNRYCSVPQCKNKSINGVFFHIFPKEQPMRAKWVHALKIGKDVTKFMFVCSAHFLDEDFLHFNEKTVKKRLKRTSTPSCNLPIASHSRITSDKQLKQQSARAERVGERRRKAKDVTRIQSSCNEGCSTHAEPRIAMNVEGPTQTADEVLLEPQTDAEALLERQTAAEALLELQTAFPEDLQVVPELKARLVDSATQVNEPPLTILNLIKTNSDLNAFTGIPSMSVLSSMSEAVELIENFHGIDSTKIQLDITERIVLVMMKLKLNISFTCISIMFGISLTSCIRYFNNTLPIMSAALEPAIEWPSKEDVLKTMPKCFKNYRATRIVLDCTETPIEKPACLKCRLSTYSHYKGGNTIKFLVGVAPEGLITYVSPAYGGRASDKAIFLQSDLLQRLIPYCDKIMSDKGFLVEHECQINGIELIRPPFLGKSKQFTVADGLATADIAQARVHVERSIQRIKIFKILKGQLAWNLLTSVDHMMTIIAGVVNLSQPILAADKF